MPEMPIKSYLVHQTQESAASDDKGMYNILLLLLYLTPTSLSGLVTSPASTGFPTGPAQHSNFSSSDVASSEIFPYPYDIPNSPFHLNIGFGHPRQSLDFRSLRSTLLAALAFASMWSSQHGSGQPLPQIPGSDYVFRFSIGEGISISIAEAHYAITWGTLEDILRGLKEYLVDGRRPYLTRFEFTIVDMPVFGHGIVKETERVRVDKS